MFPLITKSTQLFNWLFGSPKVQRKFIWWEKKAEKFSTMWNFSDDADEEEQNYFVEGTEGLCPLSPIQVICIVILLERLIFSENRLQLTFLVDFSPWIVQRIYAFAACLLAGFVFMFMVWKPHMKSSLLSRNRINVNVDNSIVVRNPAEIL